MKPFNELKQYTIDMVTAVPCVYYLFHNGKLRYIGKTGNLRQRIKAHKQKFPFNKILFEEFSIERVDQEEVLSITTYCPPLNNKKTIDKPLTFIPWGERSHAVTVYLSAERIALHGGKAEVRKKIYNLIK